MSSWLDELVEQHSEMETPLAFWKWAGLVSISAVVKDQVWINRGGAYNLYPNIYCILFADSGLKKGPATNLAKKLIKEVNNTKLISGRSSIQGIMKRLGQGQSQPGGKIQNKSHGCILSSELSASLVNDPAALDILTDLYDRNYNADDWDSLLKMEEFKLRDPTITLFGGINPAHANAFFNKKDISGGFLARSFIIHEKEEHTSNSLVRRLKHPPDIKEISKYLKELLKLSGPFVEFEDAQGALNEVGQYYDEWYNQFKQEIKKLRLKDETGTLNRYGDSVLKVAMLLSLSKVPILELQLEALVEAIALCEKFIGGVRIATQGKTSNTDSSNATRKTILIQELMIRDNHAITRTQLNKKYWMEGNVAEWDDAALSIEAGGMIKIQMINNQAVYTMPDEQFKELDRFMKGKNK